MKAEEFRKLIREEVRSAIKEELKDILIEAVDIASNVPTPGNSRPPIQDLFKEEIAQVTSRKSGGGFGELMEQTKRELSESGELTRYLGGGGVRNHLNNLATNQLTQLEKGKRGTTIVEGENPDRGVSQVPDFIARANKVFQKAKELDAKNLR